MQLQQMRDAVRAQLDLDEEDLPNVLVDSFLEEAQQQTLVKENLWPFLQSAWNVNATDDGAPVPLPPNVDAIESVVDSEGNKLFDVSHEYAEQYYASQTGSALLYSLWGGNMYLWPKPEVEVAYTIRGWRVPAPLDGVASAEPDCDVRLHLPMVHYACSRAYAQQEDEVLANEYLRTWSAAVEGVRRHLMRPKHVGRFSMGEGVPRRHWFSRLPDGLIYNG